MNTVLTQASKDKPWEIKSHKIGEVFQGPGTTELRELLPAKPDAFDETVEFSLNKRDLRKSFRGDEHTHILPLTRLFLGKYNIPSKPKDIRKWNRNGAIIPTEDGKNIHIKKQ